MRRTLTVMLFTMLCLSLLTLVGSAAADDSHSKSGGGKDSPMMTKDNTATSAKTADYRTIPLETINGDTTNLKAFEGKVVLIVNVASKCGYTKQYAGLEELYKKYQDKGLVVIGFPANNFGGQEPGTNEEIQNFCQANFGVTFPMMAKISVKGDDIHPLFAYLTEKSNLPGEIKWNFSKFLLDRKGNLVTRWDSPVEPMSGEITKKIEELL